MSEYLVPEFRWRRVVANLRLGSKGFLFQECCFQKRLRNFQLESLKRSRIFIFKLNLELIIDVKLALLSGCSLGHLNMRRTLASLSHLSRPLMSWLMIFCCWKTSWYAKAATYYSLGRLTYSILTREQLMHLMCSLLRFYMKWRTAMY